LFNPQNYPIINRNIEDIKPVDFDKEFKFSTAGYDLEKNSIIYSNSSTINNPTVFERNLTIRGITSSTANKVKFNKNIYVKGNLIIGNSDDGSYKNLSIEGKHFYVDGD